MSYRKRQQEILKNKS